MFINKNKVEESLDSFQIDATNFVRIDSTSFEEIIIFNGKEPVYVSGTEYVEFYRELILTTNFDDAMKDKNNRWLISEKKDEPLPNYGMLSYVRTLFDSETNEKCGYVIATVSANQLDNLLSLSGGYQNSSEREFLPHSVGISIDDKILFLGENIVKKGKIIFDKENFQADGNELYFVNISNENEFFTIHSTKALTNKILVILSLFILVFAATTLTSYKILIFLLNEICGRINKLNYKIEMSSPTKEETK